MAKKEAFVANEPPCSHACPCGTDVRGFTTALARGGEGGLTQAQAIEEAFYIIADRNPIPATLGRLCPHHCETGCSGETPDGGVPINQLERAIAEAAINAAWPLRTLDPVRRPVPVTVVGAGAAGLSAAYQLARRGYRVMLADPHPEAGGELRYGVDAAQLPRPVLDAEVERILALGVTFAGSCDVAAAEAGANGQIIRTEVYEDGARVAFEGLAAAVHFGRHAAERLDAELQGMPSAERGPVPAVEEGTVTRGFPTAAGAEAGRTTLSLDEAVRGAQRCLTCGGRLDEE